MSTPELRTRERLRHGLQSLGGAAFLAVLLAPTAGSMLWRGVPDRVQTEMRAAWPRPRLPRGVRELERWPRSFDAYYQDSFGLRGLLIGAHSRLRWFLLGESPTERLIVGDEGWVFYTDGSAVETLRAPRPFGAVGLETSLEALAARRRWVNARGAEYLYVSVPDKSTLYEERVPVRFRPACTTRREQLFAGSARREDVRALDLLPALRAELLHDTQDDATYNRYGTHWTERGALAGYRAILAELARDRDVTAPWPREEFEPVPDDDVFADSWGRRLYLERELDERFFSYRPRRERQAVRDTSIELPHRGRLYRHPDGSLPRAVILHDSFGPQLVPALAEHFSQTWSYWVGGFDCELLEAHEFDLVIQVEVERTLRVAPPCLAEDVAGAYLGERFERSTRVLLQLEAEELAAGIRALGSTRLEPQADGLAVVTQGPSDRFTLPAFDGPSDGSCVLRLDLTSPAPGHLVLLYLTADEPDYAHDRAYTLKLSPGRQRVHLQLASPDIVGRLAVRPAREAGRFVLHGVGVRACDLARASTD